MKSTPLFLIIILAVHSLGQAQVKMPAATKHQINRMEQQKKEARFVEKGDLKELPMITIAGTEYVSVLAETNDNFDREKLISTGIIIGAHRGSVASLKVPLSQVASLKELPGVDYLKIADRVQPQLQRAVQDVRADSVHDGFQLIQPYSGKDVLIGVTDWGFDYTHPMFYDTALQETRILAAWDQYKTIGPAPAGFNYGTEYVGATELLNAQVDTSNIYSYATHGSHVAGIAGGSGGGSIYQGVAFSGQFLFATFLVDEGSVVDAFEWMYQKSLQEDKRLVINMSWGLYYFGTLDGNSLLSEVIEEYIDLGVVFVTSGGNNGDAEFHIKYDFANDTMKTRVGFVPNNAVDNQDGQSITMWGEVGEAFHVGFDVLDASNVKIGESAWYATATAGAYTESDLVLGNDTFHYDIEVDAAHPRNNRPHIRLRLDFPTSGGKFILKATSTNGTVHFWNLLETTTGVGNTGWDFVSLGAGYIKGDNEYSVGEPACTEGLITVGAYQSGAWNNGTFLPFDIADFSSIGPTLDGRIKPDITAPGVNVISSLSSFTDGAYTPSASVNFQGKDYGFIGFSGTSMSSPMVTGTVALMLEANPSLTPQQIKYILQQTAREDNYTGTIPGAGSLQWGHGKVHAWRAVEQVEVLLGMEELQSNVELLVYPNPASASVKIETQGKMLSLSVYSLEGKELLSQIGAQTEIDLSVLSRGTYVLRAITNEGAESAIVIRQ